MKTQQTIGASTNNFNFFAHLALLFAPLQEKSDVWCPPGGHHTHIHIYIYTPDTSPFNQHIRDSHLMTSWYPMLAHAAGIIGLTTTATTTTTTATRSSKLLLVLPHLLLHMQVHMHIHIVSQSSSCLPLWPLQQSSKGWSSACASSVCWRNSWLTFEGNPIRNAWRAPSFFGVFGKLPFRTAKMAPGWCLMVLLKISKFHHKNEGTAQQKMAPSKWPQRLPRPRRATSVQDVQGVSSIFPRSQCLKTTSALTPKRIRPDKSWSTATLPGMGDNERQGCQGSYIRLYPLWNEQLGDSPGSHDTSHCLKQVFLATIFATLYSSQAVQQFSHQRLTKTHVNRT